MGELYHFTKAETVFKILEGNKFLISNIKKMNDLDEISDFIEYNDEEEFQSDKEDWMNMLNDEFENTFNFKLNADLKEQLKNYYYNEWDIKNNFIIKWNNKLKNVFVGSFTCLEDDDIEKKMESLENKDSMWGHYANIHKGCCIIFDKEKLDFLIKTKFKDDIVIAEKIQYTNDAVGYDFEEELEEMLKKRFFKKNISWSAESEFRYLIYKENREDTLTIEDIVFSIKGIIFGNRIENEELSKIIYILEQYKCQKFNLYIMCRTFSGNTNKVMPLRTYK